MASRLTVALFRFTSCGGCQQALFSTGPALAALAREVDLIDSPPILEADDAQRFDVAVADGSISTLEDARRIQLVRERSEFLIAVGACATAGGIQALSNQRTDDAQLAERRRPPKELHRLEQDTPVADHVEVDFELHGCPIDAGQLIRVLTAALYRRYPRTAGHSVCIECKRQGNVCVTVARGLMCLGPVTEAGCGALCPAFDRGCYGCFGPSAQANVGGLIDRLIDDGLPPAPVAEMLQTVAGNAPEFRTQTARLAAAIHKE